MRAPTFRASFDPSDMIVDGFAGGGGASKGIEMALGRSPDIAINHDPEAIACHEANHPNTKHYREDIWQVDPREVCGSRSVGVAWFSPDCRHFSRAKGGAPVSPKIRSLAWVVTRWARAVKPRILAMENVEEIESWGPLGDDGRPDKSRAGRTFRAWVSQLRNLGYDVEWRSLVAADYGAPTTRKRLYLIARCDGQPIVWPRPTHGPGRIPWRIFAECIDWSSLGRSIFGRPRPLKPATLQRIGRGILKYVMGVARPFMVPVTHHGDERVYSVDEPLRTVTGAHRGEFALIEPYIVRHGHYSTKTGAGIEEGKGCGTFRGQALAQPLSTVCATNDKHLVCPIVSKHYGGVIGHDVERPLGTVTAIDHHSLTTAVLSPSQEAGAEEVRSFLIKYYGAKEGQQQGLFEPLHTVTTKARFGLVSVRGIDHTMIDILMRMLFPRELFRAQSFGDDYIIDAGPGGKKLSISAQTRLAGNSVCPVMAKALIAANTRGESAVAA